MLMASKLVFEESLVYSLFIDVLWLKYGLHLEIFWLYALLLAIYMRNFAYLCIMVWILMDAHGFVDICIKIYKNIYYIKNTPKPESFEIFVFCSCSSSRSQVTLPRLIGLLHSISQLKRRMFTYYNSRVYIEYFTLCKQLRIGALEVPNDVFFQSALGSN